jgi:hypothetical protein
MESNAFNQGNCISSHLTVCFRNAALVEQAVLFRRIEINNGKKP